MPWLRYEDNIKNIIFLDSVELGYDSSRLRQEMQRKLSQNYT
jgi:hypothetical protein